MSIQAECREAMNRLAEQGAAFTEIDVANEAASDAWSSKHFDQAVKHSYNVLQGDYKKGRLVRFGPVAFKSTTDYARRGSKILYASTEHGPQKFQTPNGVFPRMYAETDPLIRAGRRVGTNRDDTKPWGVQNVSVKASQAKAPTIDPAPLLRRIEEQQSEINRLKKVAAVTNGNGNGQHVVPDGMPDGMPFEELIEMLINDPRLMEGVKNSLAEALIS